MNTAKDSNSASYFNILYIIYKGTVSHSENRFRAATVYFPVQFVNVLKEGETVSYNENKGIAGWSDLDGGGYSTKGYVNPLVCYMEIVETAKDAYNVSSGDGFEVYGQYENIAKLSDISEACRTQLYADAKDIIASYIVSEFGNSATATDPAVKGEYLLTAKTQGSDFSKNNSFIIVFAATLSSTDNRFQPTTVYFPVRYDGVVNLPGGEFMVTSTEGIQGGSDVPGWGYAKCYVVGTEMFTQIVTANREQFKYEVSDGLKEFGE